jgi:organic hydroperoxide reductase OsmC/OhrA
MGAIAVRHEIDLVRSRVGVKDSTTDKPVMRFSEVVVEVFLPGDLPKSQQTMLERAADGCPIKHSFGFDIPVRVSYHYEESEGS